MRPISAAIALAACAALWPASTPGAAGRDQPFDDPLFRRCISWMMDGYRGAMLQNVCLDEFELPPPSLFLCARKVRTGFASDAIARAAPSCSRRKPRGARAGYVK